MTYIDNLNKQLALTMMDKTEESFHDDERWDFPRSLFSEDVNNCTMTSRLILPEHYVKGNTRLVEENRLYLHF